MYHWLRQPNRQPRDAIFPGSYRLAMADHNLTIKPEDSEEQEYLLKPLTPTDRDTSKSHVGPQECRARITCDVCGTYDDFIYEELSAAGGWKHLCGQAIYQCESCDAVYTLDDVFPGNSFPSCWVYWISKEKAISHLSWLDAQANSTPSPTMTNNTPRTIYEVASQLTSDGFLDSELSVRDGVLSITILTAFRQFGNSRYADCCKVNGFVLKSTESEQLIFSVRFHIAAHPYNQNGEPDIPAIQAAASQSQAAIYIQPPNYTLFRDCLRHGSEILEAQLTLVGDQIMEEVSKIQNMQQ